MRTAILTVAMPVGVDCDRCGPDVLSAFERADMSTLSSLLHRETVLEMPPFLSWFAGRDTVQRFFALIWSRRERGAWRMERTSANRQPAVAACARAEDGLMRAHSIEVFSFDGATISQISAFIGPPAVHGPWHVRRVDAAGRFLSVQSSRSPLAGVVGTA